MRPGFGFFGVKGGAIRPQRPSLRATEGCGPQHELCALLASRAGKLDSTFPENALGSAGSAGALRPRVVQL